MNILTFIGLVLFGFLAIRLFYLGPWQSVLTDWYRERLYDVRWSMFKDADTGALSFNDDAYRMLERHINGMIRFAHRVDFWEAVAARKVYQQHSLKPRFARAFSESLSDLPKEKCSIYTSYYTRIHVETTRLIITRSAWLAALVGLAYLGRRTIQSIKSSRAASLAAVRFIAHTYERKKLDLRWGVKYMDDEAQLEFATLGVAHTT